MTPSPTPRLLAGARKKADDHEDAQGAFRLAQPCRDGPVPPQGGQLLVSDEVEYTLRHPRPQMTRRRVTSKANGSFRSARARTVPDWAPRLGQAPHPRWAAIRDSTKGKLPSPAAPPS